MKKLLSLHTENQLAYMTGSIGSCHWHKKVKQSKNKQNNNRMAKVIINSYDEFAEYLGKEIGTTDWFQIDQDRINLFADATLDYQWIHVDVERAKTDSPFKSTIAHGYLTMSLLPKLWYDTIEVNNVAQLVNYGLDKMKFGMPVITGSSIRMKTVLHNIQNLRGVCKAEIKFTIEIQDQRKPALEGIATFLYYFNK